MLSIKESCSHFLYFRRANREKLVAYFCSRVRTARNPRRATAGIQNKKKRRHIVFYRRSDNPSTPYPGPFPDFTNQSLWLRDAKHNKKNVDNNFFRPRCSSKSYILYIYINIQSILNVPKMCFLFFFWLFYYSNEFFRLLFRFSAWHV